MTITINGELSPSEFLDIAQYFKENELDILTLKEPLYVCGAKISRVNNKIIIDALTIKGGGKGGDNFKSVK